MHATHKQTGSLIVHTLFKLNCDEPYLPAAAVPSCDDTGCACCRGDLELERMSLVAGSG